MSEAAELNPPSELAGFRIGVTSHRRADELIGGLERRGAQVLRAPALRLATRDDVDAVVAETRAVLALDPDVVLVTTGYGLRRWLETADGAGLGDDLRALLGRTRLAVRGNKAKGQVRALELPDPVGATPETMAEVVSDLLAEGVSGLRVGVQLHGLTDVHEVDRLRSAGARVLTVAPYRWESADQAGRLADLVRQVCDHRLDAVTFAAAPAVDAVLALAEELGRRDDFIAALNSGVAAVAIGPVCAAPLEAAGVTPFVPDRFRQGAMVKLLTSEVARTVGVRAETSRGEVIVRSAGAIVGEVFVPLSPAQVAIMKTLAERPGAVVSRPALLAETSGLGTEHALEMAISRLRRALPLPIIETVLRRGYRLAP